MSAPARIAVIGTGWWSTYTHIPALLEHADAQLVALCDANGEKLAAAADAYGVEHTYQDLGQMLATEQLDGAVIATPHATHYKLARACLEHNLHVMIEKPMTLYARDAKELLDLAAAHQREIVAGYPWHYAPHVLAAREALLSGELGAVEYVNCTFSSAIRGLLQGHDNSERPGAYPVHGPGSVYSRPELSGGGMGHLQLTHSLGAMFFVSGLRASRALALMRNHGLALDMVDSITAEFEGGALGALGGTGNGRHRKLDVQVHCEYGAVDLDLVRNTVAIRRRDDSIFEIGPLEEAVAYPRYATSHNLVDIILGRAANGSPGEVGWRTVELLDAAYRSAAADGAAVRVAELYEA